MEEHKMELDVLVELLNAVGENSRSKNVKFGYNVVTNSSGKLTIVIYFDEILSTKNNRNIILSIQSDDNDIATLNRLSAIELLTYIIYAQDFSDELSAFGNVIKTFSAKTIFNK